MQSKGCMTIFCNSFCCNSPNLESILFANHRSRTAEEGSIPKVVTFLQHLIKEFITHRDSATSQQVALKRVRVIEPVGSLHKRHFWIKEKADCVLKELP